MHTSSSHPVAHSLRQTPLAVLVVAAFAAAPHGSLAATTWPVTSCLDDGGATTLRARVTNAASGDTVDLSGLACATISLASGGTHITVAQNSLTIVGPAATTLTIDGSALATGAQYDSNVFAHTGTGVLTLSHVALTGGHVRTITATSAGGCVRSAGDVALEYASVSGCRAYSNAGLTSGGGVYAAHDLTLTRSSVSGNTAKCSSGTVRGGGVHAAHSLVLESSTISGNVANGSLALGGGIAFPAQSGTLTVNSSTIADNHATSPTGGRGGGLYGGGLSASIAASTISGNTASHAGGGIYFYGRPKAGSSFDMINSTISGNHSDQWDGGIYIGTQAARLSSSTIAFNSVTSGAYPGLYLKGPMDATLQSTLAANNSGTAGDLFVYGTVTFNAATPGNANNLIGATAATGLPADTLFGACPLLGPLRDNGGPTKTHALWSGSPAVDAGNVHGLPPSVTTDQRGSPFARVSGIAADIGAYETQQADILFGGGFDGC